MQTEWRSSRPITTSGWRIPGAACALALVLAGCGTTSDDGVRNVARGKYKPYRPYVVGVPYKIKDIRYYPKEDMGYDRTGIASWYGPNFHGKRTANGEEYNQNAMTAAHPTLPMPTIVKVTNLENGRSIVVRINDRGPFADDRIIDLSKEAARRIDMIRNGTARVRVRVLRQETLALKRSGRVYADMAALNRRYVDGQGDGTVISAARKEDSDDRRDASADRRDASADRKVEEKALADRDTAAGGNVADDSARRGTTGGADESGDRAAVGGPVRIAPRSYVRASGRLRSEDLPPADHATPRKKLRTREVAVRTEPRRRVVTPAPAAGRIFVQAAAYTEKSKARRVRTKLGRLARSRITAVQIQRTIFYRVRLGPVNTTAEGDQLLARVVAMGYRNARVVIDPARR